jgi:hypothetical protein
MRINPLDLNFSLWQGVVIRRTEMNRVEKWIEDGCPSFGVPEYEIKALLEVVKAMASFDGRNNNAHLKQMAKDALNGKV